ncbi:MAG: hypothetical protein KTR26_20930 [Flammeovirgaceae bacterium]|nr:hypothetical protein [Flammeovirgaceae bacterium]
MISSYIQKLENEKEGLLKIKTKWIATKNSYKEEELSEALASWFDTTLVQIDTLEQIGNIKLNSSFK